MLLHIVKHIDDGLGLRQLCDWMGFVKNELNNEVWNNEFQPVLKKAGLENLACVVTKLCKIYLGLSDEISWCDDADEKTCDELMRYVMDCGNFGKKNDSNIRNTMILGHTNDRNIFSLIANFQRAGCDRWKAAQRFKVLRCLAWAYIPVMYLARLIGGKRSLAETKEKLDNLSKRKSLQDKLAIYR